MKKISCVAIDLINADKPPAGLAFLAGACEVTGKDYTCFSLNSHFLTHLPQEDYFSLYTSLKLGDLDTLTDRCQQVINEVVAKIQDFKSDAVVISVFSYMQIPLSLAFLRKLKQQLPNIPVMAGGPGINHTRADGKTTGKLLLEQNLIDYYCLGEGDEVLPAWLQGDHSLLGLNSRENSHESWVPQIDDLDSKYLIPSYKKIDTVNYHNMENKSSAVFSLSTSRGCVRSCSFCDVGNTWKKFRFRSGHHVAQEILKHHQEVGAVHFTIVDSLINGSLKSFSDFNNEMIKLKQQFPSLKDFSYNGMFIVRDKKSHPESFFETMKKAGCESLAIGVETGSDRLRVDINKKFTNDDLDHHLEMCQRYGIKNNLLTFVGYPTETHEDFQQTLDMLQRYQKYLIDDTIIGINHSGIFGLLPGTPTFEQREEIGIHWEYRDNERMDITWFNVNNPDLTVKERIRRDLTFRRRAAELRYPIPYSMRYLEYMKSIAPDFQPIMD
jgi:anaerobic magnesium-protoporphyrin IX monomethyl ester cyclase